MAFTGQNVLDRARQLAGDTPSPHRFDDTYALPIINDAIKAVASRRPDSIYIDPNTVVVDDPADITALSSNVPLRDTSTFREALAHYVASRFLAHDSEDANNQRLSAERMQSFVGLIS